MSAGPKRRRRRRAVPALLIDATGVAKALGVCTTVFYRLDAQGMVPAPVTLGLGNLRRRLWSVPELKQWVRAGLPPRHEWAALKERSK